MTTDNVAEMTPGQLRDKLAQTRAELTQLRKQSTTPVQECGYCGYRYSAGIETSNFNVMAEHIKSCPAHPLAKALTELAQARSELKDLRGANRSLVRQLADVTDNRKFWYEKAQDAEAGRDKWRGDWESVTAELLSAQGQLTKAQTLLAAAQKATEWLWGYYDGNTLTAKAGYEDDIRKAWGDLLVAVDPADDAILERLATAEGVQLAGTRYPAPTEVNAITGWMPGGEDREHALERLATLDAAEALLKDRQGSLDQACIELDAAEAALEVCGIAGIRDTFDGLADAIQQMSTHIQEQADIIRVHEHALNERDEALQAERRLRQEAERDTRRAEVLVKELRGERDYWERTADQEADQRQKARHNLKTERQECYNLHAKIEMAEQRAEALARLVTPELAKLLEDVAEEITSNYDRMQREPARALAARIREVLEVNNES